MKLLLLVVVILGQVCADVEKGKYTKEENPYKENEYQKVVKHGVFHDQHYHGLYYNKCKDGFYYKDAKSFVICCNSQAYVQYCAPGSKNSPYLQYSFGETYFFHDFCNINLVSDQYELNHYGYNRNSPQEYVIQTPI